MGLHHRLIRQFRYVIKTASLLHAALVRVRSVDRELVFEGLNEPDNRAMPVAKRDGPDAHRSPRTRLVVDRADQLDRPRVAQSCGQGAMLYAHLATDVIAVQQNVPCAGMAEHVNARVAGELFRTFTPKYNLAPQIEHAHPDLQFIEDVAINLWIGEVRHDYSLVHRLGHCRT